MIGFYNFFAKIIHFRKFDYLCHKKIKNKCHDLLSKRKD